MTQAVIVYIKFRGDGFGDEDERDAVGSLQDTLEEFFAESLIGDFDGDLWGEGECILYFYGPDADELFRAIEPILAEAPVTAGGYAIKRYGEASDPNAVEVRVTW